MKNNRAQFFGLYIIILTLFLCGMSIGIYLSQQQETPNFLVSPREVIAIQTDLEMFEIREVQLIEDSLSVSGGNFPNTQFNEKFLDIFLDNFKQEGEMTEFIFNDLTVNGADAEDNARANSGDFFKNTLYPSGKLNVKNGELYFSRGIVGKKINLVGKPAKLNFPVNLTYNFEREYLIKFENNKYVVEKV